MNDQSDLIFPTGFFDPPATRPDFWPDNPELRRAVDWFKSFIPEEDWIKRRENAARRLYLSARGVADPSGDGRFFDSKDSFGWYLFLAEALLDHIHNYDYVFGSRVIPVFQAIGRDLDLLLQIQGIEVRVRRMVGNERAQPNGSLFELLVAACYRRANGNVAFIDEQGGKTKTHDMDVILDGRTWAVECKRMEVGEYGQRERVGVGKLWEDGGKLLVGIEKNTLCHARFRVAIEKVSANYLMDKVKRWLASSQTSLSWDDATGWGTISELDLLPLQKVLSTDNVLGSSHRILELLTGHYIRNANYRTMLRTKPADNARYVDSCDLAVVLHWESLSEAAVDGKARDIRKKLSEATEQLPNARPGIVHIGFEAVEGDSVERVRHEKILATARQFDPEGKQLEYVYCHYFVPESPPDQCWAFDETTQWCAVRPQQPRPLGDVFLVLPTAADGRNGPHWK